MAIALVATVMFLPEQPKPARRTSVLAPLKVLKHRGLLTMSITALLYNWAFFTMLGYAPFPTELGAIQLGLVFFGWGIFVAIFAARRAQPAAPVRRRSRSSRAADAARLVIETLRRPESGAPQRLGVLDQCAANSSRRRSSHRTIGVATTPWTSTDNATVNPPIDQSSASCGRLLCDDAYAR